MGVRQRLLSMVAMAGDRKDCLASGMDNPVTPPIRMDARVEAMNQVKARSEN